MVRFEVAGPGARLTGYQRHAVEAVCTAAIAACAMQKILLKHQPAPVNVARSYPSTVAIELAPAYGKVGELTVAHLPQGAVVARSLQPLPPGRNSDAACVEVFMDMSEQAERATCGREVDR